MAGLLDPDDLLNPRNATSLVPTPPVRGNLPPPRMMPYPQDAGREVEPKLHTTQPWGPYRNSLPGLDQNTIVAPPVAPQSSAPITDDPRATILALMKAYGLT
jgi:hypothetical protein